MEDPWGGCVGVGHSECSLRAARRGVSALGADYMSVRLSPNRGRVGFLNY